MSDLTKFKKIQDTVKIGSYEEVDNVELSTITKNAADKKPLSGLILRGYETKFNSKPNENYEVYAPDALNAFVDEYFVKGGFNMPVDIEHEQGLMSLAGRVLVLEVNTVGYYFVVYVPKTYRYYQDVKHLLEEGILQGFSKYGYSTKWRSVFDKEGNFSHELIEEMKITRLSIVSTPANIVSFEQIQETKNELVFKKSAKKSLFKQNP